MGDQVLEVTRPISLPLRLSVSSLECNLEMCCTEDSQHDFIVKAALNKIRNDGIKQKIRVIVFDGDHCPTYKNFFLFIQMIKLKLEKFPLEFIHQD